MRLPNAPIKYHSGEMQKAFSEIERSDNLNHKKMQDLEIGDARLILKSPDGTRYSVTVDNSGNLSAASI
jgi:hypothetical protein